MKLHYDFDAFNMKMKTIRILSILLVIFIVKYFGGFPIYLLYFYQNYHDHPQ